MVSSPGFVSNTCHSFALFRLAFASPSDVSSLSLPHALTRWLILLKARRQEINPLRPVVSTRFQVLFTPLAGVLFTFPSRYFCAIGRQMYLALDSGLPFFPQN